MDIHLISPKGKKTVNSDYCKKFLFIALHFEVTVEEAIV